MTNSTTFFCISNSSKSAYTRLLNLSAALSPARTDYQNRILNDKDPTIITPVSFATHLEWQDKSGMACMPNVARQEGQQVRLVGRALNLFGQKVSELSIEIWGVPKSLFPALGEIHKCHANPASCFPSWVMQFGSKDFSVSEPMTLESSNLPTHEDAFILSPTRISGIDAAGRHFVFNYIDPFLESFKPLSKRETPIDKVCYLDSTISVVVHDGQTCGTVVSPPQPSPSLLKNGPTEIMGGRFGRKVPEPSAEDIRL